MSVTRSQENQGVLAAGIDWLRMSAVVLAIVGAVVAGYLAWAELTDNETACLDTGSIDCTTVQNSAYSSVLGIPVAVLGVLGFVAIFGLLVLEDQIPLLAAYGRTLVLGMAMFGVIFQFYLTLIEGLVLDAWCQWCVASFIVITLIAVISAVRLKNFMRPLKE